VHGEDGAQCDTLAAEQASGISFFACEPHKIRLIGRMA
jgi:hypothetical protein